MEKLIKIDKWVPVAYDELYNISQVTSIISEEEVNVIFLKQTKDEGQFKWPRPKDCAKVETKYIFSCDPRIQRLENILR